jgi:ACS family hexuronate transporter-like MFS transporter
MSPFAPTAERAADRAAECNSKMRWLVCGLLFLATTINYMDRSVFSLIEPALHQLPFMGWKGSLDAAHQQIFNNHFANVLIFFQAAYGIGFLCAGRLIDKLGTRLGYALAISLWAMASMGHVFVNSVGGFCLARFLLGLGESGNFPAAIKAIAEWFPAEERALATGLFNSGSNFASLVAPLLIPFVTALYGWRAGFLTTGSMGLLWLVLWLCFPYDRLRPASATAHPAAEPEGLFNLFAQLARTRRLWAFSVPKALTDPVWWFYLFWLPKYFNENYGLDLKHVGLPLIVIYCGSSVGSIGGGWLSGFRIRGGASVAAGRRFALLTCACGALPVVLVPLAKTFFPANIWMPIVLLTLAAAAHQGWSANLYTTSGDMFPASAVSTVNGIGGASGALGGVVFTFIVKATWTSHPILIFGLASCAYLVAFAIFRTLAPRSLA